jgi:hypothetical protein
LLHVIHEGIECIGDHATEVAHASYMENKLHEHQTQASRTAHSLIVVHHEGEEEDDDTGRLSDLIALAKIGLQAKEEDDTSRLSELIALADDGL